MESLVNNLESGNKLGLALVGVAGVDDDSVETNLVVRTWLSVPQLEVVHLASLVQGVLLVILILLVYNHYYLRDFESFAG